MFKFYIMLVIIQKFAAFKIDGTFLNCYPLKDYFEFECDDENTNDNLEKLKCYITKQIIENMKNTKDEYHKFEFDRNIRYIYT
jgi:hypothetical protein